MKLKVCVFIVITVFLVACGGQSFGGNVPQAAGTVPSGRASSSTGVSAQNVPTGTAPGKTSPFPTLIPTLTSPPATATPPATSYLPLPTSLPTYTPTPAPGQNPPPTSSATQPAVNSGNLVFGYGTTAYTVVTNLSANAPQTYTIYAHSGQALYVMQNGSFSVQVLDPQGNALTGKSTQAGPWGVGLTASGAYTLQLSGTGHAVMTVHIPPTGQNQVAVPFASSRQRVSFAPGATGATLDLNLTQGVPQSLVLYAGPTRRMLIDTTGDVTVALANPGGQALEPVYTPSHWEFPLATVGDYTVILLGVGPVTVTTTIPVP